MSPQPKRARTGLLITLIAAVAVAAIIVWIVVANLRSTDAAASEVPQSALPDSTSMGVVELQVADLDQMRGYYETALGLRVLNESADAVELGLDQPLITLQVGEGTAPASTPSEAGLYHSAILYPDEAALARVLLRIATVAPNSFQGSADHKVSLAFYFVDPEGNGLELYTDRPSDEWNWVNGEVEMGAYALDPNQFITEHLGSDLSTELGLKLDPDATADMGHVHMKVGDLAIAE
ncbi:MAG: hypothetical protein GX862_00050 [Leucobacter sp.]|nr:hypothetical protein [Leucobacter sp.]